MTSPSGPTPGPSLRTDSPEGKALLRAAGSVVPPEVQALHLRLFERYLTALITHLEYSSSSMNKPELCSRIERLLALDGSMPGRAEFVYLTSHDYDALDEIRGILREFLNDPTTTEEFLEEGPSDAGHDERSGEDRERHAGEPDGEGVLQEVSPIKGRGTERDTDHGLARDTDVVLPELQPAVDLGSVAPEPVHAKRPAHFDRGGPDDIGVRVVGTLLHDERREVSAAKQRGISEATIDAIWESHPDKTRATVARMLRGGLLEAPVSA